MAGEKRPIPSDHVMALIVLLNGEVSTVHQHQPMERMAVAFQVNRGADAGGDRELVRLEGAIAMPPLRWRRQRIEMTKRKNLAEMVGANSWILRNLKLLA